MNFEKDIHYSVDLEAAILGACLLEADAFGRTYGIVEMESFYFEGSKTVYRALAEMFNNGVPIDIFTVQDYLINVLGHREISGSLTPYYVVKLTNAVVSSAHLEYHCHVVKRMWMERELIGLTHGGIKLEGMVKEQIYQLSEAIQRINSGTYTKDWQDMSELIYNLMKHQEEMVKTGGKGIPTGIEALDRENGGFFGGQLVVIGARPSVGKSAFMGQMAIAMAKKGHTVGIISLEMNNNEIAARLSSLESNDDFRTIFRGLYRDQDHQTNWYDKMRSIINLPIFVSDKTKVNTAEIRAKAMKLRHEHGLSCIMVDYLQLVSTEEGNRNRTRENEVSQISRMCKLLAKDLNIPVIVLCQLNRASTQRTGANRFPQLSDLRESGSIEQDADVVMFIHRDWMLGEGYLVDEKGESTENKADLIVRKWRNGASNVHVHLEFNAPKMMFVFQNGRTDQWKPETTNYNDDNPF